MASSIGERLRHARQCAGLGQVETARRLKVDQTTVSGWERGRSVPRADVLRKLARILDADLLWLLTGEGQRPVRSAS